MNPPKTVVKWQNYNITNTWLKTSSLQELKPITQIYGICFNDQREILICKEPNKGWQLPGGTPEPNEALEEALTREFLEEVDAKIKDIQALGVQQVEFPNNPNREEGELFYQARYICKLEELLPQTPDPDTGELWERRLIPADQVTEYIKWGELGDVLFKDALEEYIKNLSSAPPKPPPASEN